VILLALKVDGMLRNRWTEWIGISGRNDSEWVDGMARNTQLEGVPVEGSRPSSNIGCDGYNLVTVQQKEESSRFPV